MSSELKEEALHLSQIRSITVGIQERKPGKRVLPEGGHNLVPALGVQQMHVHVLVRRHAAEAQPAVLVSENIVRGWVRWKKCELCGHVGRHIPHLNPNWNESSALQWNIEISSPPTPPHLCCCSGRRWRGMFWVFLPLSGFLLFLWEGFVLVIEYGSERSDLSGGMRSFGETIQCPRLN